MPLVQLLVTNATNGNAFDLPAFGNYDIIVVGYQFHSGDAANVHRVLQIQSDKLRFVNSPLQYLTFINNGQSSLTFNSALVYSIKNVTLNGKIQLGLLDMAGDALPAAFQLVLTLDICEKI
jgi:hypothetical protein